jgi:hypothetical protein
VVKLEILAGKERQMMDERVKEKQKDTHEDRSYCIKFCVKKLQTFLENVYAKTC